MKKPLFVVLILSLTLSACLPAFLQQPAAQAPQVDIHGTAAVIGATMAAKTIAALPSQTPLLAVPSGTLQPLPTSTLTSTPNPVGTATVTTTGTVTTKTPTLTPVTPTATQTLVNGEVAATETLHPRYYGTMPPKIPYGTVLVLNKAKAEAYISLQCTTSDGNVSIIEFPVKGSYGAKAPAGHYFYVAWVGGKKMEGNFKLDNGQDMVITLYKNSISIK
jgi:hypothetical protein